MPKPQECQQCGEEGNFHVVNATLPGVTRALRVRQCKGIYKDKPCEWNFVKTYDQLASHHCKRLICDIVDLLIVERIVIHTTKTFGGDIRWSINDRFNFLEIDFNPEKTAIGKIRVYLTPGVTPHTMFCLDKENTSKVFSKWDCFNYDVSQPLSKDLAEWVERAIDTRG